MYFFRNLISALNDDGHETQILASDYIGTRNLLNELDIDYTLFAEGLESKAKKIYGLPLLLLRAIRILRNEPPDLVFGFGVYSTFTGALLRKPSIVFTDSEHTPMQLLLQIPLADSIITPSCFRRNLGRNHVRVDSFKELAYLHPGYFEPDAGVLERMDVNQGEDYAILRFNGFYGMHDVGVKGFTLDHKRALVKALSESARVFISSESSIPQDLREYELKIPKSMIHHALYYSRLIVADTGTMVTEAAILGTPAIRLSMFNGRREVGNFRELEERYGLVRNLTNPDEVTSVAQGFVTDSTLKSEWRRRAALMISEKTDLTQYLVSFVEKYDTAAAK